MEDSAGPAKRLRTRTTLRYRDIESERGGEQPIDETRDQPCGLSINLVKTVTGLSRVPTMKCVLRSFCNDIMFVILAMSPTQLMIRIMI